MGHGHGPFTLPMEPAALLEEAEKGSFSVMLRVLHIKSLLIIASKG